jgi:hypothetical protein
MIEKDYCGTLGLSTLNTNQDQTVLKPSASKYAGNMVAGPGFEGGPLSTSKRLQELSSESFEEWQRAKTA